MTICCGMKLPPNVGKYGCPNCNGDNVNKPHSTTDKQSPRKPPSKTRSVRLPVALWEQAERVAAERGTNVNAMLAHALRLHISGRESQ